MRNKQGAAKIEDVRVRKERRVLSSGPFVFVDFTCITLRLRSNPRDRFLDRLDFRGAKLVPFPKLRIQGFLQNVKRKPSWISLGLLV